MSEERGWPGDRIDTPEVARLRAERDAACEERDRVQSTVSEHRTAWIRVNQENDKLRAENLALLCDNQTMRNALTVVLESDKLAGDRPLFDLVVESIGFKPALSEGDLP